MIFKIVLISTKEFLFFIFSPKAVNIAVAQRFGGVRGLLRGPGGPLEGPRGPSPGDRREPIEPGPGRFIG